MEFSEELLGQGESKEPQMSKAQFLRTLVCDYAHEEAAYGAGATRVAGVDECGRGTWLGHVSAGAVILPRGVVIDGLKDSKQLSPKKRKALSEEIKAKAVAWSVAHIPAEIIDKSNIAEATEMAMYEAIHGLSVIPDFLLIDAVEVDIPIDQIAINYGDAVCASIAAASIVAKVARDELMLELDAQYPGYGIAVHKGYGTKTHMAAIQRLGPCPLHRMSFRPLRNLGLPGLNPF